jgi:hypothetical protein
VSGRPDVRGGRATRGFPPGSAQALVALVLGVVAGVAGVRRGEPLLAAVFLLVALLAAASLWRLLRGSGHLLRGSGRPPRRPRA